jgi:hypothetical protein
MGHGAWGMEHGAWSGERRAVISLDDFIYRLVALT